MQFYKKQFWQLQVQFIADTELEEGPPNLSPTHHTIHNFDKAGEDFGDRVYGEKQGIP